jgi:hypothetical protein
MPDPRSQSPLQTGQVGGPPLRAPRQPITPPNPNHPPSAWVILVGLLVFTALITGVSVWVRRAAYRAWKAFAADIGGEFRAADGLSPRLVSGSLRDRPFLLETNTSHEDDAGYYHTRCRVPIKNSGSFILGLRRKSLLEAAQTRNDKPEYNLEDSQFDRQFFLYCNDPQNLAAVLDADARRELLRYPDVEVYIRMAEMEWRTSGEQGDLGVIRRLTDLLLNMADVIDGFPSRGRSLTQVLADEKMIEKGV